MKLAHVYAAMAVATALTAGCSSTPVTPPPAPAAPAPAPAPVAPPPAPVAAAPKPVESAPVTAVALPPHLDPKSLISTERSVYFDFDDSTLKSDYAALVERHGKYLAGTPALAIKVEGNTDERGSAEYNLALGQRRAESVVRALKLMGAKDAQMEAVSWGSGRPKAQAHDEAAWAQNRRADLVYPQR